MRHDGGEASKDRKIVSIRRAAAERLAQRTGKEAE